LSGSHTATNAGISRAHCNYCFSGLLNEAAVGSILLVRTFHFCSVLRDGNLLKIKINLVEYYAVNKNL
jgi:hypothetical protein